MYIWHPDCVLWSYFWRGISYCWEQMNERRPRRRAGLSPWLVQDVPAEKCPSGGHWGGRGVPMCQLTSVTSQWGHVVSTSRHTRFVSITATTAPNLDKVMIENWWWKQLLTNIMRSNLLSVTGLLNCWELIGLTSLEASKVFLTDVF